MVSMDTNFDIGDNLPHPAATGVTDDLPPQRAH